MKKTILLFTVLAIFGCRKAENLTTTYDKLNGTYHSNYELFYDGHFGGNFVEYFEKWEFDKTQQTHHFKVIYDRNSWLETRKMDTIDESLRWKIEGDYFMIKRDEWILMSFKQVNNDSIEIDGIRFHK